MADDGGRDGVAHQPAGFAAVVGDAGRGDLRRAALVILGERGLQNPPDRLHRPRRGDDGGVGGARKAERGERAPASRRDSTAGPRTSSGAPAPPATERPISATVSITLSAIAADPASTSTWPSMPADTAMLPPAPTTMNTLPRTGITCSSVPACCAHVDAGCAHAATGSSSAAAISQYSCLHR